MSNLRLKVSLILMFGAIALGNSVPTSAHKVETSENVGATLHIEPNDIPKAGEPSQTWFALTREGGDPIPLDKCDCKLSIYPEPKSSQPILQPTLKPLSTEGYKNIPSAEVNFPKVGIYNLEITGKPIGGEDFKPFKLNFKVTVATSVPQVFNPSPSFTASGPKATQENPLAPIVPIVIGLSIVSFCITFLTLKRIKKS
jgi:hypothetical protein